VDYENGKGESEQQSSRSPEEGRKDLSEPFHTLENPDIDQDDERNEHAHSH
jgi:hypothetical protein